MINRFPPLAPPLPLVRSIRKPAAWLPFRSLPMTELLGIGLMVLILASA